jgi:DNA-binding transcriptional MerR regulator
MLSIGEFAKLTGLTIKTLRLYHEKGLLPPARVDSWTGYRYYARESLERARRVVELRDLGFPLAEIREVLSMGDASLAECLAGHRRRVEEKLRKVHEAMLSLDALLVQGKEKKMGSFKLDRDIDRRMGAWLARVRSVRGQELDGQVPCFTVTSLSGEAGGEAFAAVLAGRVGFDAWDDELVSAIAAHPAHREAVLASLDDEQRAWVEAASAVPKLRIAAALAAHGRAILLELGANHLLPPERALRIRLEPPLERAIAHFAAGKGCSAEVARETLARKIDETSRFLREAYQASDGPSDHDLVINSATLDLYNAVEISIRAYEAKFKPAPGWWDV